MTGLSTTSITTTHITTHNTTIYSTTTNSSETPICSGVCHDVFRFLEDLGHCASLGIIVSGIVVVVVFVAIIAVCCDRRCRRRNLSSPDPLVVDVIDNEPKSTVSQAERIDEHTYYNDSAIIVDGNKQPESGDKKLYSDVYELAKQIPVANHISAGTNEESSYAEVTNMDLYQANQLTSDNKESNCEHGIYQDTVAVRKDLEASQHPAAGLICIYAEAKDINHPEDSRESFTDESNPYEGALPVTADRLKSMVGESFQDQTIDEFDQDIREKDDVVQVEEDTTLVDNNIYFNSAGLRGSTDRIEAQQP